MAAITFTSDFGLQDHYVAAVKATIISESPQQVIIDISHTIHPYDISHAAHVLKCVYKDFPQKTVHLVAVGAMVKKTHNIAIALDGHFFVGVDSGIFSLISNQKPTQICVLENSQSTFLAKEVLAKTALNLANGIRLEEVGSPIPSMMELLPPTPKVTKREIVGAVVAIDHYGNLITNISKTDFDHISRKHENGVKYAIRFYREEHNKLNEFYTDVPQGNCFVLFNSLGDLQIGINHGEASELMGIKVGTSVCIAFG